MGAAAVAMALLMGLTGSLHCAGMCGPIMWAIPFRVFTGYKKVAAVFFYHFARISIYVLMGVILHFFKDLFSPRIQQVISVLLGVGLLLLAVMTIVPALRRWHVKLPWSRYVQRRLGTLIGDPGLPSIAAAGMLNGLLPCGFVYMALSATITFTTLAPVILFLYLFGMGTVPMLVGITFLGGKIAIHGRKYVARLMPLLICFFGCLFILRGLNLGIPYLSPRITISAHTIHSCCSKE